MCGFCEEEKFIQLREKFSSKADGYIGFSAVIETDTLHIDSVADVYEPSYQEIFLKINYCPMCGRKLGGDD